MGLCCGLCYYGAGQHYTGPLLGVTVYGSYCNQHPSTDPALGKKRVLAGEHLINKVAKVESYLETATGSDRT